MEFIEKHLLDSRQYIRIIGEVVFDVLSSLTDPVAVETVPGTGLFDDFGLYCTVKNISSLEMPVPYMISNSACLNGGATLFLTILALVLLPST